MLLYLLTGPPIFLNHPTSYIVTVGMTVTLYCNVSSAVRVSFAWERKFNRTSWERINNTQRFYYVVRNIQKTEWYRCIAGNRAGTLVFNVATIEVLSRFDYVTINH